MTDDKTGPANQAGQDASSQDAGGTYGQGDQSTAARRSEARTDQHSPSSEKAEPPTVKQGTSALP